jgi:hypothetical protein
MQLQTLTKAHHPLPPQSERKMEEKERKMEEKERVLEEREREVG